MKELEGDDKKVVKLSVTGYSLGGLIARYAIGCVPIGLTAMMYQLLTLIISVLHQRGFFKDVERINFNTVATPHLGLLRYPSMISSILGAMGPKFLSRTGEQFYCQDKWTKTGRPLLEVMADPGMCLDF